MSDIYSCDNMGGFVNTLLRCDLPKKNAAPQPAHLCRGSGVVGAGCGSRVGCCLSERTASNLQYKKGMLEH